MRGHADSIWLAPVYDLVSLRSLWCGANKLWRTTLNFKWPPDRVNSEDDYGAGNPEVPAAADRSSSTGHGSLQQWHSPQHSLWKPIGFRRWNSLGHQVSRHTQLHPRTSRRSASQLIFIHLRVLQICQLKDYKFLENSYSYPSTTAPSNLSLPEWYHLDSCSDLHLTTPRTWRSTCESSWSFTLWSGVAL